MRNERTDEMAERMIDAATNATPPTLRQFAVYEYGVPTGPERMHVWVTALERRVEVLERKMRRKGRACGNSRIRWRGARKLDRRVEQLERGLLHAGHRIAVLEHRLALLEDAEMRA